MTVTRYVKALPRALFATFIGCVFALGLVEGAFIVPALIRQSNARAKEQAEDRKFLDALSLAGDVTLIRAITLGESTTARTTETEFRDGIRGDRVISWPEQFESMANREFESRKLKFRLRILNLGKSSTSSSFLVQSFSENVDAFRPDFVVSMMGINDSYRTPAQSHATKFPERRLG